MVRSEREAGADRVTAHHHPASTRLWPCVQRTSSSSAHNRAMTEASLSIAGSNVVDTGIVGTMRNLAPDVFRQRLLIEATYERAIDKRDVEEFLRELPRQLGLRIYSEPVVYSPSGVGAEINQGYDGFVALIDSGISIYVWERAKFVSVVVYTCKEFAAEDAIAFTKRFFVARECEHMGF